VGGETGAETSAALGGGADKDAPKMNARGCESLIEGKLMLNIRLFAKRPA